MVEPPADRVTLCERAEWLLDQVEQQPEEPIKFPWGLIARPDEFDFGAPLYVALTTNHGGQGTCEYEQQSRLLKIYKPPYMGVQLEDDTELVLEWLLNAEE